MKLYATTTSERASKGQGGNKYLNIDIFIEDRNYSKYSINITPDHIIMVENLPYKILLDTNLKGKKQKGECEKCHNTQFYYDAKSGEMRLCENH